MPLRSRGGWSERPGLEYQCQGAVSHVVLCPAEAMAYGDACRCRLTTPHKLRPEAAHRKAADCKPKRDDVPAVVMRRTLPTGWVLTWKRGSKDGVRREIAIGPETPIHAYPARAVREAIGAHFVIANADGGEGSRPSSDAKHHGIPEVHARNTVDAGRQPPTRLTAGDGELASGEGHVDKAEGDRVRSRGAVSNAVGQAQGNRRAGSSWWGWDLGRQG